MLKKMIHVCCLMIAGFCIFFSCGRDFNSPVDPTRIDSDDSTWLADNNKDGIADSIQTYAPNCNLELTECLQLARENREAQISVPIFSLPGGVYEGKIALAVKVEYPDAEIRYTTDGTEPKANSSLYQDSLRISQNVTLQARAFKNEKALGVIESESYSIKLLSPQFTPKGGNYTSAQSVTLFSNEVGSTIRYTTNGSDPDENSTIYSNAVILKSSTVIKARVFSPYNTPSVIAQETYVINVAGIASAPSFTPAGGAFNYRQTVTLSSPNSQGGTIIRYSLDGSDPTELSQGYSSPLSINRNLTIKARAFSPGMDASELAEADYEMVVLQAQASIPGGIYNREQFVALSCETDSIAIYYTLDGSSPSQASTHYTGPIFIGASQTLKARAFRTNWTASEIKSEVYVIEIAGKVSAPIFTPAGGNFASPQLVKLSSATVGASIHCTQNGANPTESSPLCSLMTIDTSVTLKAIAYKSGQSPSATSSAAYQIQVSSPVFSPSSGTYSSAQTVHITSSTGADIRYTLDGSDPISSSPLYKDSLKISASKLVKARAYKQGLSPSEIGSAAYTIDIAGTVEAPSFNPGGGNYIGSQTIRLQSGTPSASIYFTTDGTTPSESSSLYATPLTLSQSTTLKAIAIKTGLTPSPVAVSAYAIACASPAISPVGGTYTSSINVTLSPITAASTVRYTLDGSEPNASSPSYNTPIGVNSDLTIKAKSFKSGLEPSQSTVATYLIRIPAPDTASPPIFSPASGTIATDSLSFQLNSSGTGEIRYTVDGTEPVANSNLYVNAVKLTQNSTIKAKAFASGQVSSQSTQAKYFIQVATPKISPASGVYSNAIQVAIACSTSSSVIRYTLNGSEPTDSSSLYSTPIDLKNDATVKAKAFKSGLTESKVASAAYTFSVAGSPPPAPLNLSVTLNANRSASLSWDPVAEASSYTVYFEEGSAISNNATKYPNSNSPALISELKSGTTYAFAVSALNSYGESGLSKTKTVTTAQSCLYCAMKLIPTGSFMMGSDNGEIDEQPSHTVSLAAYWIDSTEVTQKDFYDMTGSTPWKSSIDYPAIGDNYPAHGVSWIDAVRYCNARSIRDGLDTVYVYKVSLPLIGSGSWTANLTKNGYRLPTEAEWEKAARGGSTTDYYWGEKLNTTQVKEFAWFSLNAYPDKWTNPHAKYGGPQLVRSLKPNGYKLSDISGNVAEWVNDWYDQSYYSSSPKYNPSGPNSGDKKVIRGGSFFDEHKNLRVPLRFFANPTKSGIDVGFRVVAPK